MAKIAVNTRLLLKNKLEGIGWFSYETLKRITIMHPEHEFLFIFDRKHDRQFIFSENVTPIEIAPPSRHPILWYLWFEWSLPLVFKRFKPDIFLSPDGYISLSTTIKSIPVIHDINFVHYPEDLPYTYQKYYNYYFPKYAERAERIITVSNFSKNDIVKNFGVNKNKIDVVYNGVNPKFKPLPSNQINETRKRFSNGLPFLLSLGALHPRKNINRLLQAFDLFKNTDGSNHQLLIVGEKMWRTNESQETYENMAFKDSVVFTGRLSEKDLLDIVPSSVCLLYISYFEGFGIPIIEGMASGIPVITSNITAMPEVAGDAALLVDPFSVTSIAGAMTEIIQNEHLRKELIIKGVKRSKDFSWDKSAQDLWNTIESIL